MADNNKLIVRIYGQEYTLVGPETEEHMHKVALLIDKRMREVAYNNSRLSTAMTAVLTALNVGDELIKANKELEQLRSNDTTQMEKRLLSVVKERDELKIQAKELKLELEKLRGWLDARDVATLGEDE